MIVKCFLVGKLDSDRSYVLYCSMNVSLGKSKSVYGWSTSEDTLVSAPLTPPHACLWLGARVVLFTPRKRQVCSENGRIICVFSALCLMISSQYI